MKQGSSVFVLGCLVCTETYPPLKFVANKAGFRLYRQKVVSGVNHGPPPFRPLHGYLPENYEHLS
jgi:hypothetical protein